MSTPAAGSIRPAALSFLGNESDRPVNWIPGYFLAALASATRPKGITVSTFACGRAMIWTATTSPHAAGRDLTGVAGRLDGRDIAADDYRDVAAAGFFVADQFDFGRFDHCIGRFKDGRKRTRFNHA
jgi:hypothetical protein